MKPKEKADELIKKAMPLSHDWESDNLKIAIKIAILCVNEILDLGYDSKGDSFLTYKFYSNVKIELLNYEK